MSITATWKELKETWLLPVAEYIKDVNEREGYLASISEMDEAVQRDSERPTASGVDPTAGLNPNFKWDGDG